MLVPGVNIVSGLLNRNIKSPLPLRERERGITFKNPILINQHTNLNSLAGMTSSRHYGHD